MPTVTPTSSSSQPLGVPVSHCVPTPPMSPHPHSHIPACPQCPHLHKSHQAPGVPVPPSPPDVPPPPPNVPTLVDSVDVEMQRVVGFPRQPDVVPFLGRGGTGTHGGPEPPPQIPKVVPKVSGSSSPLHGAGGVQGKTGGYLGPLPCDETGLRRGWGPWGGGFGGWGLHIVLPYGHRGRRNLGTPPPKCGGCRGGTCSSSRLNSQYSRRVPLPLVRIPHPLIMMVPNSRRGKSVN